MNRAVHFVGFSDDRYHNAIMAFGKPDFIHRFWDRRAQADVAEDDVVVFADDTVSMYVYDDSAFF